MYRITTRKELLQLARNLGVRPDWHEPDEQEVTARVFGQDFDNAMPPATWLATEGDNEPHAEQYVVLYREGEAVAAVNLATLFAWATGYQQAPTIDPERYRILQEFVQELVAEGRR